MSYNVFDPGQWADVTGFAVVAGMAVITVVAVLANMARSGRWADWLDQATGRGSVDDPWDA